MIQSFRLKLAKNLFLQAIQPKSTILFRTHEIDLETKSADGTVERLPGLHLKLETRGPDSPRPTIEIPNFSREFGEVMRRQGIREEWVSFNKLPDFKAGNKCELQFISVGRN